MSSVPSLPTCIDRAFNDSELRDLCFKHFPAVLNVFTTGMTKPQMIQLLLGYCVRRRIGSALLDALEQERPGLIGLDREVLLAQLDAARFDGMLLDAPSVLALPLDTIPDVAPLPAGSRMPLVRNPLFVGREADLKQLAATLKGGGTAAIGQIAAATGLGGIGKTNLASEFVHRYGQFFTGGVFWLSFAEAVNIPSEIAACGGPGSMNLPGLDGLSLDDQVARVRREWQQSNCQTVPA